MHRFPFGERLAPVPYTGKGQTRACLQTWLIGCMLSAYEQRRLD